jgi:hypothetical protein
MLTEQELHILKEIYRECFSFKKSSFFFFGSNEDWAQSFALVRQMLHCLSHTSSPVILETESRFLPWLTWIMILPFHASRYSGDDRHTHTCTPCFFFFSLKWCLTQFLSHKLPETTILPNSASHIAWDDRHVPPCPTICWDGLSLTFYPGWPQASILPVSVSQVARIIDMCHWCTASFKKILVHYQSHVF